MSDHCFSCTNMYIIYRKARVNDSVWRRVRRTQPFIAAIIGESQQYVIVCEGRPLCVIKTLQVAFIFSFFS